MVTTPNTHSCNTHIGRWTALGRKPGTCALSSPSPAPPLQSSSPFPIGVQLPAWLTRGETCDLLTTPGSGRTSQGQVGHGPAPAHSDSLPHKHPKQKTHAAALARGSPHRMTPRRRERQTSLCVPRTSHLISLGLSACLEPGEGQ